MIKTEGFSAMVGARRRLAGRARASEKGGAAGGEGSFRILKASVRRCVSAIDMRTPGGQGLVLGQCWTVRRGQWQRAAGQVVTRLPRQHGRRSGGRASERRQGSEATPENRSNAAVVGVAGLWTGAEACGMQLQGSEEGRRRRLGRGPFQGAGRGGRAEQQRERVIDVQSGRGGPYLSCGRTRRPWCCDEEPCSELGHTEHHGRRGPCGDGGLSQGLRAAGRRQAGGKQASRARLWGGRGGERGDSAAGGSPPGTAQEPLPWAVAPSGCVCSAAAAAAARHRHRARARPRPPSAASARWPW
jgi:hypothetical protein